MPTFYDENSPRGPVPGDSEPGVVGMRAALTTPPMPGGKPFLPGYYNPGAEKVAFARVFAPAPAVAYFSDQPPAKFADESQLAFITFRPVPAMEKHIGDMNAGYNPYDTKEPKARPSDHIPTNALADALANQGARSIGSSDDAMLALIMGA